MFKRCLTTWPRLRAPHVVLRHRSWSSGLQKTNTTSPVIIENSNDDELLDIKHYVRTTDIPHRVRIGVLADKITQYVKESPGPYDRQTMSVLDKAVMDLYKNHNQAFFNEKSSTFLHFDTLLALFDQSATSVLSQKHPRPRYLGLLARAIVKLPLPIPGTTLILLVELTLTNKSVKLHQALASVLNSCDHITLDFFPELLEYYDANEKLNISTFEDIFIAATNTGKSNLLDDRTFQKFMSHVESLYAESHPRVHEYADLERSIYRVQYSVSNVLAESIDYTQVSSGVLAQLAKMARDLDSVVSSAECVAFSKSLVDKLDDFDSVEIAMLKDESLAEFLLEATLTQGPLGQKVFEFSQNVPSLQLYGKVVRLVSEQTSEIELLEAVKKAVLDFAEKDADDTNFTEVHSRIVCASMLGNVSPTGVFILSLDEFFTENFQIENTVDYYRCRIDKSIANDDYVEAVNIFEDSRLDIIQWTSTNDPRAQRTLNDLIVLLCEKMSDISDIFPIFTKIKQQMTTQCNPVTIRVMANKMLAAEYVGDLIEMLSRELPKIDKDARIKLPLETPVYSHYRNLFDVLQSFVVTYQNESTFETNWKLYEEIHRYFHVPFESYLPTLKFFCEKDRLHAALVIFRQIKRLNELHGDHQFLPPLREIYMLLFNAFGDKLYEEGVTEIHEYLKMDVSLTQQDIQLQNCLLNAYSNLQDVPKTRDLFLAMSATPDHVNEETLLIMVKTYTYSDLMYVKEFWNTISTYGIAPDYSIFRQYLIAHVYHGSVEGAIEVVEEMKDFGYDVTSDTLLAMHNYCLETEKQKELSQWASKEYKEQWNEVVKSGLLKGATNYVPSENLIAN